MDTPASSENEALRAELAEARHQLDDLRVHFPDALLEGDLATERLTFMNRLACLLFGCTPEEVTSLYARDLFAPSDYDRARGEMRAMLERGYAEGAGTYSRSGHQDLREFLMRRRDGTCFPAETHSSLILDLQGHARGVRTMVRDISQRKEMEARLEELTVRDPLTGCFNRRYLERQRGAIEGPGHWVCLLFDLTDFKGINDTYGHEEGDRVLQAFAHFLARQHRADDILVRLGGDEFALFMRAESEDEGRAVAARVKDAAAKDSPAAFGIGVAFRRAAESVSGLLTRADHVLYASKGQSLRSRRRQPPVEPA
jgi:diguanylate cyclase (GGDEF)-like protein/PAS domain S-box-containing protein